MASLEQVGSLWDKFIDYIIHNSPKLCIHVEPVAKLLDPNKLIDYLSIEYLAELLSGFLDGLQKLERDGKVKIHSAQRTNIGNLFIEGYSVMV